MKEIRALQEVSNLMLQPLSGYSAQSQTILYAKAKHISSSEISKWLFCTEPFNILLGGSQGNEAAVCLVV
jgi:hypothetical protein